MEILENPLTYLGLAAAAKFVIFYKLHRKKPRNAKEIGRVSRITLFPVKSMRGVDLEEAECTWNGLKSDELYDRTWLVTDENGHFLTGRQLPRLVLVDTSVEGGSLCFNAPEQKTLRLPLKYDPKQAGIKPRMVRVWGSDIEAYDCGPEAAAWISSYLGGTYRIVRHVRGMKLRETQKIKQALCHLVKPEDKIPFHDAMPYLMMSQASVDDLNTRLDDPVTINNFRPNIVIEGCDAYEEDNFKQVFIGDARMSFIQPCVRCIFTTVNMEKGVASTKMEPLETLRKYRCLMKDSPCMGINLVLDAPGSIHVGDKVYATTE